MESLRKIKVYSWSLALASAGVLAAACQSDEGPGGDQTPGDGRDKNSDVVAPTPGGPQTGLTISPLNHVVELDLNEAAQVDYSATWLGHGSGPRDVTEQVTWSLSDESVAQMMGSTLMINPRADAGAWSVDVTATDEEGAVARARVTIIAYKKTGERPDFFFTLPEGTSGEEKPLTFATAVQDVDVFFNMDTTGSMAPSIQTLQSDLKTTIIPGVSSQVRSAWFGVGAFEDFPVNDYGSNPCKDGVDQPFELLQEMTSDVALAQAGVDRLSISVEEPIGCGGDGPEAMTESIFQIATGAGLTGPGDTTVAANSSGLGGVGFREGSLPIIVSLSDISSHNGALPFDDYEGEVAAVAATNSAAIDAIKEICGRVVGVGDTTFGADFELQNFAQATGAVVPPLAWGEAGSRPSGCAEGECCTEIDGTGRAPNADGQCPLSFIGVNGGSLSSAIVTGIDMLSRFAAFDTETEIIGESTSVDGVPLPDGVTTADFIESVTPVGFEVPAEPAGLPEPVMTADAFEGVTPGTRVSFQVRVGNDLIPGGTTAQFFRAKIQVLAGGCFPVDEREVLIVVPPEDLPAIPR